ncbi:S-adenosyl-L-methionine-dependent methyltransferase [Xylariaceae sp. FL1651]|nr:S-adenosyl-L-methionine-dependent methyltransferase [Xylariaceae sp. FL1651]
MHIKFTQLISKRIYRSFLSTYCRHFHTPLPQLTRRYTQKMTSENSTPAPGGFHFSCGSMYEKLVGETSTRLAAAALSLLPLATYTPASRILDSACGTGIVTKLLLSPSPEYVSVPGLPLVPPPRVIGIDLSESMIDQYKVNASSLRWDTAEAYVQDSQDLSRFPDNYFDVVAMNCGIFALRDAVAGAREMRRVLRPGGHAVVTMWKTRRPLGIMKRVAEIIRPGDGTPMDLDPKWEMSEHLAAVMKEGGFSEDGMRMSEAAPNWTLGSLSGLVEGLSSPIWMSQFCKGWSDEEKGRWREEIAKQLTEEEKATGTLEMAAHICVAQKEG